MRFIVSAACYEHRPLIGHSGGRIAEFETALLEMCNGFGVLVFAWCILPNHYHILIETDDIVGFRLALLKGARNDLVSMERRGGQTRAKGLVPFV